MPPSSDDLPGRRPPTRKERRAAGRAEEEEPGKQPGVPGAAMRWRKAEEVVDHFPQGDCECGADLADAADLGVARSCQQEDIPEPQLSRRSQYRPAQARCACGRVHVAARLPGAAQLSVGPRLSAMAVYLGFQHVPVERAQFLIADLTGGVVSARLSTLPGQGRGWSGRGAADPHPDCRHPGRWVRRARCGPGLPGQEYVHGAFTELHSAFWLGTRSPETMREAGSCLLRRDRRLRPYAGYYSDTGSLRGAPSLRRAHHPRPRRWRTHPVAAWPEQAIRSLRGLIRAWRAAREKGLPAIPPEEREPLDSSPPVTVGLAAVSSVPGPRNQVRQQPGRECSNPAATGTDVSGSRPTPASADEQYHARAVRPQPSRRSPDG